MSNNFPWTPLAEDQDHPELPVNDAFNLFDQAETTVFVADVTSGDVTISAIQAVCKAILISGASVAGRKVMLPVEVRAIIIKSDAANTQDVTLKVGTTEIAVQKGDAVLAVTDGTANGLTVQALGGVPPPTVIPIDLGCYASGTLGGSEVFMRYIATRAFTLPAGAALSQCSSIIAATASSTITAKKNGTSFATIAFSASGSTGTFTQAADAVFAAGDILTLTGAASADATLAGISITLAGVR